MFKRNDFSVCTGSCLTSYMVNIYLKDTHNGSGRLAQLPIHIFPHYCDETDRAGILLASTQDHDLAFAYLNFDEDAEEFEWVLTTCDEAKEASKNFAVPPRSFMHAILSVFPRLGTIDYSGNIPSTEDVTTQILRQFIPVEGLNRMTSVDLRNMAVACEVQPNSIKKDDVIEALTKAATAVDSPGEYGYMVYQFNDESLVLMDDDNNIVTAMDHDGNKTLIETDSSENRLANEFDAEISAKGNLRITSLEQAGIDVSEIVGLIEATKAKTAYSDWMSSVHRTLAKEATAEKSTAVQEANDRRDQFDKMIDDLRMARETIEIPDGAEVVMVCGEDFQRFGSPKAPPAVPNYSLDYWRARQRLGSGAKEVVFSAADFLFAALNDRVTSLVGPPGTGKTTIVQQCGHILGIPVAIVQFTRDKPVESLVGVDKIIDGSQQFVPGEISRALLAAADDPDTPYFIVLDEFDHAPAEVQSELHGVVEGREFVMPNGEVVPNHGNVRFIVTRNTTGHGDLNGRHSAANVSDSAFNSRISTAFMVDYMLPEHERTLLCVLGLSAEESENIVKFANKTRDSVALVDEGKSYDGMSEPVCLRHLMAYARMRSMGRPIDKCLAMTIISQLPQRDRSVANELAIAAMGLD